MGKVDKTFFYLISCSSMFAFIRVIVGSTKEKRKSFQVALTLLHYVISV